MTRKMLATTVIPFFFATAAVAQSDMVMGEDWNEATVSAFFADDGAMTPLDEAEMRTNWSALSAEDQATVMASCANVDTAMTSSTAADEADVPDTNSPAASPSPSTGGDATTGSAPTAGLPEDSNSPAASPEPTTSDEVENEPTTEGTGQSNASTFGEAGTGTGISMVDEETWTEVCATVQTF